MRKFILPILFQLLVNPVLFGANTSTSPNPTLQFQNALLQVGNNYFSLKILLPKNFPNGKPEGMEDYEFERELTRTEFDSVDLYNYVEVKPATKYSISTMRGGFFLIGEFRPQTQYTINLKKGLHTKDGITLPEAATKKIVTGNLPTSFKFKSNARYMPQSLQGTIAWEAMNLKKVTYSVRQIYPQNIHQWLTTGEYSSYSVSDEAKNKTDTIKGKVNQSTKGTLSLSDLEVLGQGIFEVTATVAETFDKLPKTKVPPPPVQDEEGESEGEDEGGGSSQVENKVSIGQQLDKTTLVVTNLSLITKMSRQGELMVWVTNTKDLTGVAEASVDLLSQANRKMNSCKTQSGSGFCLLKWKPSPKNNPYAIIVHAGKDLTFLRLSDLVLPNDSFHAGNRDYTSGSGSMDAFVYLERNLYRPGETVNLAAMVRNKDLDTLVKLPTRWTITNPRGKVVREAVSETGALGMTYLSYPTSSASDTGQYSVSLSSGSTLLHETTFLVEEFVPERIGISLKPEQEFLVAPKSVSFNLQANYLFGPPVAEGTFNTSCWLKPAFTSIPKNPDYATGIYSREAKGALNLQPSEGKTSATGAAKAVCDFGTMNSKNLPETYEMKVKVDVAESGSARVSTKTSQSYVGATDSLLGLRLGEKKDKTIFFDGKLFNYKGEQVKRATQIKLKLFRRTEQWYYAYDRGDYTGDSWKVEEIVSPTAVEKTIDSADGSFKESLKVTEDWGDWIVRAIDTKTGYTADLNAGSLGWWYNDSTPGSGRAPPPEQLKVDLSSHEVSPGETLKASITAPFAGRILFALETDKVIEQRWVDTDKAGLVTTDFKIPNVIPNVYVTALLLKRPFEKDSNRWIPARAWGASSVSVISKDHRLDVKVTHPELSESRKTVTVNIANTENVAAEYTLAAVDEGILQMTNFQSPDPLKRFFEPRRLGVDSAETLGWTVAYSGLPKNPGGDEAGGDKNKTMPVKLVTFWFPKIMSDSSGKATVNLSLPSFQGKLRIMVVASAKSRLGSSSTAMTVRDPLVLQSTLPRFLTKGDKIVFPSTVTNLSGKPQTVKISVISDSNLEISKKEQTLTLALDQQKTALFEAEAKGFIGQAKITIRASSDDNKLTSQESFDLPLKPSGVEQSVRFALPANKETPLSELIPAHWSSEYLAIEATLSNLPYLDQLSRLKDLVHYPYGCIEQTTSSTLPLLYMGTLLPWIDPQKDKTQDINAMVYYGINRVLSMQTGSGGFAYWPGDYSPNPWGTAYATYMLLEAKKIGFDVSNSALDAALQYLQNFTRENNYGYARARAAEGAVPLALYVLAKAGKPITTELRTNAKNGKTAIQNDKGYFKGDGIIAENMFLMMAAAKLVGDKDTQRILGDESLFTMPLTGSREYYYSYWSPLRSDGLRLAILQDVAPTDPAIPLLATRLAAELAKQNDYYSTQDLAWATVGLGKQLKDAKKVDLASLAKAQLSLNGKKLAKSFEVMGYPGYQSLGVWQSSQKIGIVGAPAESGLHLYVRATGYSKTLPETAKSTLVISRSYYHKDGSAASLSEVKLGDTLVVGLKIRNLIKSKLSNLAVVDRLPSGFEIENSRLQQGEELGWLKDVFTADYVDLRDDRIQVFGALNAEQTAVVYYSVRAVTKGTYVAPASFIEAMYEPATFDYDQDTPFKILDPEKKK